MHLSIAAIKPLSITTSKGPSSHCPWGKTTIFAQTIRDSNIFGHLLCDEENIRLWLVLEFSFLPFNPLLAPILHGFSLFDMKILRLLISSSIQASSYKSKLDSEMPSYVCVTFNCLWIKDRPQSIHQIRAGNLTKFNEYFTISRILIVFLASIAKLCKTEPPKSLPLLLKSSSTENITEGHRRTRRSGNKTELWY